MRGVKFVVKLPLKVCAAVLMLPLRILLVVGRVLGLLVVAILSHQPREVPT